MFDLNVWLSGLVPMLLAATVVWMISVAQRNVTIVDTLWSLLFAIAAWTYASHVESGNPRTGLVLALVTLWSLRLALYLGWRSHGQPEDRRYAAIRKRNEPNFAFKSLYRVFGVQAVLAWLISLPLLGATLGTKPLTWVDDIGAALVLLGIFFETVGDWQLTRFKADPANAGRVMDRGLWRYTRHPNYFGDFCVWWGFFLIALSAGAWWSFIGPLLMSVLLLRVSGVTLLEKDIAERRPGYSEYVRRTNAFFPGPPRA